MVRQLILVLVFDYYRRACICINGVLRPYSDARKLGSMRGEGPASLAGIQIPLLWKAIVLNVMAARKMKDLRWPRRPSLH